MTGLKQCSCLKEEEKSLLATAVSARIDFIRDTKNQVKEKKILSDKGFDELLEAYETLLTRIGETPTCEEAPT